MKKKAITLFMAGLMLVSMTACGNNSDNSYMGTSHSNSSHSNSKVDYATDSYYTESVATSDEADWCGEYYEEQDFNTEEYNFIEENGFVEVSKAPLSTFAADVDTGSYCNLRRLINDGWDLANVADSIRTEEMINYFDYTVDNSDDVFSVQYAIGDCPWNDVNKLLVMTMQANSETEVKNEGNNFVFLIDTSGSMSSSNKLPLAIESFKLLAGTLGKNDRVSIVTYSGSSSTLLEGSNDYSKICSVLDGLSAGGGTNGSGGIEAAYRCAEKNFVKDGNNRVIIASDGDMNLGITSQGGLVDLITEKKETGVFLTVLGYGSGNYSDANMESIADAGNGNYFYIDSIDEAERVLCEKMKQTTLTVAKDVKFQLEFNPAEVVSYRQIGYENRQMSASDFSDDTKDGGEIGAGAQVTVVYELVVADDENGAADELKYQDTSLSEEAGNGEICTVSVRYKAPDGDVSSLIAYPIRKDIEMTNRDDFEFVAGIIEASMVIRGSSYVGNATIDSAYQLAKAGSKNNKYREEFCELLVKLGAER